MGTKITSGILYCLPALHSLLEGEPVIPLTYASKSAIVICDLCDFLVYICKYILVYSVVRLTWDKSL